MKYWTLDIESYYEKGSTSDKYNANARGLSEYIKDPRWKCHGLAVLEPTGTASFVPEGEIRAVLEAIQPEDTVLGHNWAFDGLVLAHHYGWKHWNVTDTLLLANAVLGPKKDRGGGNSLGELAEELGLEAKGRLDPMEGVRDLSDDEWDYLSLYAKKDVRLCRTIHDLLLPQLRTPGPELWLMRHSLNLFINRPVQVSADRVTEARGQLIDWSETALKKVMAPEQGTPLVSDIMQLSSDKQFAELLSGVAKEYDLGLPVKTTTRQRRMPARPQFKRPVEGQVCRGKHSYEDRVAAWAAYDKAAAAFQPGTEKVKIPALAKLDHGFQQLLVCGVPVVEDLCKARAVLKSERTVAARLGKLNTDSVHMSLIYHGAGTGRWAGGGNGWNPQNIPSPGRAATEEQAVISRALRSCLVARPGHRFVHVDLAQAEARVVAWMAGQWDLVKQFANGEDVYSTFISKALGVKVVKPVDGAKGPQAMKMKALRAVGKESILGLGFSMAKYKFHDRLRAQEPIRRYLGDSLNFEYTGRLVKKYRTTYPAVPRFWDSVEAAFHKARRGTPAECGPLRFEPMDSGSSVWMYFPSGRRISYRNIRRHDGESDKVTWLSGAGKKIYGGLLTENAVQGTARDILARAIYLCEREGFPVKLTVHDSLILEVHKTQAEEALAFVIDCLRTPPSWGPDLALDAEGYISNDFN